MTPATHGARIDRIADDVLLCIPLVYRRILRSDSGHSAINPQSRVLGMLSSCGPLPMSEIAQRLAVSKPHATALIDALIAEKDVERSTDPKDRRIVRIALTARGRAKFLQLKALAQQIVKKNISALSEQDLGVLCESMKSIRQVLSRMEKTQ